MKSMMACQFRFPSEPLGLVTVKEPKLASETPGEARVEGVTVPAGMFTLRSSAPFR